MLVFNLSAVQPTESIIFSEVHIYKKRRRRSSNGVRKGQQHYRILLYDISQEVVSNLGVVEIAPQSYGWQAYDVTRPVHLCRDAVASHRLLGVKFEVEKNDVGRYKTVPPKRVMKKFAQPFLIIFSNDDEDDDDKRRIVDNESSVPGDWGDVDANSTASLKRLVRAANTPKEIGRVTRSIHDNELPGLNDLPNTIPLFPRGSSKGPSILKGKKRPAKSNGSHKKGKLDSRIIPIPENLITNKEFKTRRRKGKGKKGKRRKKNKKFPAKGDYGFDEHHKNDARLDAPDEYTTSLCHRRRLVVDFASVGWSEWIIAPKSFGAHYCAGSCPFPLTKNVRPTNHAIIQSLFNLLGNPTDVPTPCCVPDAMSSVSVLYLDEGQNVVLKTYADMSVKSCSCR